MIPDSKFQVGDYVRTVGLEGAPYEHVTGVIRERSYEQHVNTLTNELLDEWSWGYMVEFERDFPVFTGERFLRKARLAREHAMTRHACGSARCGGGGRRSCENHRR